MPPRGRADRRPCSRTRRCHARMISGGSTTVAGSRSSPCGSSAEVDQVRWFCAAPSLGRRRICSLCRRNGRVCPLARGGAAPGAARPHARDIAAIGREVPAYARPLEGPFGRALRSASGAPSRASSTPSRTRPRGTRGTRLCRAGPRRVPRRAQPRRPAERVSYRARLAWERFVAAGEAAGHEPARCTAWPPRSSATSTASAPSRRGLRAGARRAEGERQRRRRARAAARARRRAARGGPRPRAARGMGAADDAGRTRDRRRHGDDEPDADRLASRLGGDAIAAADGATRSPGCPIRRRRAAARSSKRHSRARQPRSAPRWYSRARALASRGPAPRTRSSSTAASRRPARRRRRPSGGAPAPRRRQGARRRSRRARPRAARRPSPGRRPPPARHPAGLARPPGPGEAVAGGSTCIRRPCATASPSCASCSATASRTRTRASSSRWRCGRSRQHGGFLGGLRGARTASSREGEPLPPRPFFFFFFFFSSFALRSPLTPPPR